MKIDYIIDMASFLKLAFMCLFMAMVVFKMSSAKKFKDLATTADKIKSEDAIIDDEDSTKTIDRIEDDRNRITAALQSFLLNPLSLLRPRPNTFGILANLFNARPIRPRIVTQTLKIVVTRRVTRHPICMTISNLPVQNCVPDGEIIYYPRSDADGVDFLNEERVDADLDEEDRSIEIEPTASLKLPSELSTADHFEELDLESRSGRYLTFAAETPAISEVKSEINEEAIDDESDDEFGRFLPFYRRPIKYATKTLFVTKVKRVTDFSVTATLIVDNCVPVDTNIPFCRGPQAIIRTKDGKHEDENNDESTTVA